MSIHYIYEAERQYPGEYQVDLTLCRRASTDERVCLVSPRLFEAIADYTNSMPTGPSHGRVYKKDLGWQRAGSGFTEWDENLRQYGYSENKPHDWWIYFVRDDPSDPSGQFHYPFRLLVSERLSK